MGKISFVCRFFNPKIGLFVRLLEIEKYEAKSDVIRSARVFLRYLALFTLSLPWKSLSRRLETTSQLHRPGFLACTITWEIKRASTGQPPVR